jgi:hypothetical protein
MKAESRADLAPSETAAEQLPGLFAVISWGCAATQWLAKALNSHPDIFCLHASNHFWAQASGNKVLQGVDYLELIASEAKGYLAAGDVHGVARIDVPAIRDRLADRFRCVVVVRNPLPRFASQVALFNNYLGSPVWGDMLYLDPILSEKGLDIKRFSYEELFIFHAANMLNAIVEEKEIGAVYRSEDLTSDPSAFADFVQYLVGDVIARDEEWAARVVAKPAVNRHRTASKATLTELERLALSTCVRQETWAAYRGLGYQISEDFAFEMFTPNGP